MEVSLESNVIRAYWIGEEIQTLSPPSSKEKLMKFASKTTRVSESLRGIDHQAMRLAACMNSQTVQWRLLFQTFHSHIDYWQAKSHVCKNSKSQFMRPAALRCEGKMVCWCYWPIWFI